MSVGLDGAKTKIDGGLYMRSIEVVDLFGLRDLPPSTTKSA